MHEFDEGCGFAIVTNDTAEEKIEEQLGKATKAKIDPTSRLTNKIQTKLAGLWNIKISCRYHSADTQQKPTQSKKLKTICFASSNMEN